MMCMPSLLQAAVLRKNCAVRLHSPQPIPPVAPPVQPPHHPSPLIRRSLTRRWRSRPGR